MYTDEQKVEAAKNLSTALPYFRKAVKDAAAEGNVKLGILASQPDGSGRIVVSFDCEDFFKDLEIVLNMPPQTEEQDRQADARAFLQRHGIKPLEEE